MLFLVFALISQYLHVFLVSSSHIGHTLSISSKLSSKKLQFRILGLMVSTRGTHEKKRSKNFRRTILFKSFLCLSLVVELGMFSPPEMITQLYAGTYLKWTFLMDLQT